MAVPGHAVLQHPPLLNACRVQPSRLLREAPGIVGRQQFVIVSLLLRDAICA
jgi:hypothetical protein